MMTGAVLACTMIIRKKLETSGADGAIVTGELDVFKSGVGDVLHVRGNGTGAM